MCVLIGKEQQMHEFRFEVVASVERTSGKFTPRDVLEGQLLEALEGADPGQLDGDDDAEYEVTDWNVEALEGKKRKKPRASAEDPWEMGRLLDDLTKAYIAARPLIPDEVQEQRLKQLRDQWRIEDYDLDHVLRALISSDEAAALVRKYREHLWRDEEAAKKAARKVHPARQGGS
jgi:hypothetical protein